LKLIINNHNFDTFFSRNSLIIIIFADGIVIQKLL
jgi:hypothetical protein